MTPPALDHMVRRCLAKDPEKRWQSASDLASELKWIVESGASAAAPLPVRGWPRRRERLGWLAAVITLASIAVVAMWPSSNHEPQRLLVTSLQLPPKTRLVANGKNGPPAISPDGTRVAFVANEEGTQSIWIRTLDTPLATRLPGTDGAYSPFWSPDSRWLAFFVSGKLRKVEISGGSPQDICTVEDDRGGSWGIDGTILLTPKGRSSEIYRVLESGGEPVQVTKLQKGINSHRWPYFLPDGKHFVYLASPIGSIHPNSQIRMASVDGKEDKLVLFASSNPEFADGRLMFIRDGTLMTVPMDAQSGKLTGEAHALLPLVTYDSLYSSGVFSVSASGMLLYQSGVSEWELQWTNSAGKLLGKLGSPASYGALRMAPDDKRVVVSLAQTSGPDIWIVDAFRNTTTRVTFNGTVPATTASWSPDGHSIAYADTEKGKLQLFIKAADGTGEERQIDSFGDRDEWLTDWSSDGRYLLFYILDPETQQDVWAVPADGSGKPIPVVHGRHNELNGRFSPDSRWVAYVSDESGRNEVYVVPFRHGQGKSQVSTQGANDLTWARDGKMLYYVSGEDQIWSVTVAFSGDSVELGTPQRMFSTRLRPSTAGGSFDVTHDGRFLVNTAGDTGDESMLLVQNWKAQINH
jgi:Tol biopolymer transport system component